MLEEINQQLLNFAGALAILEVECKAFGEMPQHRAGYFPIRQHRTDFGNDVGRYRNARG
jgi:hypothetical protein